MNELSESDEYWHWQQGENEEKESNDGYDDSFTEATKELGEITPGHVSVQGTVPSCHKCNVTNVFMIQCANEEGNSCMTCLKCLFNMIIETGVEQFCKDNKEFEGMLFGYKDKFKT